MAKNKRQNIKVNVTVGADQINAKVEPLSHALDELVKVINAALTKVQKAETVKGPGKSATESGESGEADIAKGMVKNTSEVSTATDKTSNSFFGLSNAFGEVRKKLGSFFTFGQAQFDGLKKKWDAFAKSVSAKAKTAFRPMKDLFNSLFGTAIRNGASALGNALITAVASTRQMQEAIGHLKEGFAQMVAPIAAAVAPALASLTNIFATVLAYARRLFSFLTGKTVTGAEDTAQAVADVGTSAGKTAKQTEEATRTLAGFDEITRLGAPKESGSGSGGGGWGVQTLPEPAIGFTAHSPFLDQLLAAIEGGKYGRVGTLLAA